MRSLSADNGISRRMALTRLGASALGLAFMNSSRSLPKQRMRLSARDCRSSASARALC